MQPQHQMYPIRHDPGLQVNHLTTTETQDLIHSQAPKMNNPVVPFFYNSLANSTTKGLQSGSIIFGKNPICQRATNLSEFIAKQVPCQSGLFLKHEPNDRTVFLDIRMMESLTQLTVPSAVPIQISLSANPNQLKTERSQKKIAPL